MILCILMLLSYQLCHCSDSGNSAIIKKAVLENNFFVLKEHEKKIKEHEKNDLNAINQNVHELCKYNKKKFDRGIIKPIGYLAAASFGGTGLLNITTGLYYFWVHNHDPVIQDKAHNLFSNGIFSLGMGVSLAWRIYSQNASCKNELVKTYAIAGIINKPTILDTIFRNSMDDESLSDFLT